MYPCIKVEKKIDKFPARWYSFKQREAVLYHWLPVSPEWVTRFFFYVHQII